MPSTIIPTMKYEDAPSAIDWLCKAFGFAPHLVVPGPEHSIAHAQLTLNGGMIMLGSVRDTAFDALYKTPKSVGGVTTQSAYIVVLDVDSHFDRAKKAGAEIVAPPTDQAHGGRLYSCRDPEGHLWNFGSYDPGRRLKVAPHKTVDEYARALCLFAAVSFERRQALLIAVFGDGR
ncbi:MAG: putative glyoxalase superfamily protein PhnB [Gammaproteobacteria bacterium]|jgi:uncharacterized glyoxalase superfamily protein PhnB